MDYKGYHIQAVVKSYDSWSINDDGSLDDWQVGLDGVEVVNYEFYNDDTDDTFYADQYIDTPNELDGNTLKELIDDHIKSLTTFKSEKGN